MNKDKKIELYENYFKAATNLIDYLIKNRIKIPDKYWVPYEAEQMELCWELAKEEEQKE